MIRLGTPFLLGLDIRCSRTEQEALARIDAMSHSHSYLLPQPKQQSSTLSLIILQHRSFLQKSSKVLFTSSVRSSNTRTLEDGSTLHDEIDCFERVRRAATPIYCPSITVCSDRTMGRDAPPIAESHSTSRQHHHPHSRLAHPEASSLSWGGEHLGCNRLPMTSLSFRIWQWRW